MAFTQVTYFKNLLKADKYSVTKADITTTGDNTTQTGTGTALAGTVTTGALTTAANGTTSVVLTISGVVAGSLVLVTLAGGTNTVACYCQSAVATTDTVTVVLRNGVNATTALNGTVKFHFEVIG